MQKQKRILICPLDWGLGHAARCIPIIRLLLEKNATVLIAADGRPLALLKQEFPQLEFIRLKGYNIHYPKNGSMVWKMILSVPEILKSIRTEHNALKKIIHNKKIDVVISDNRFGLWNKKIKSIFITHQLVIKSPVAEKLLHQINLRYIKKYDECWIPDNEGSINFSGELSHIDVFPKNIFFIGTLSRFDHGSKIIYKKDFSAQEIAIRYDVMAIISGPEPQRSIFENIVLKQIQKTNLKALIVCGKTETEQKKEITGTIEMISHLKTDEMRQAILNSGIIIARSGYSTIMDLAALRKKVIFIPTPGQTEQEYLADLHLQNRTAYSQMQTEFDLQKAMTESVKYTGFKQSGYSEKLENRIDLLLM